MIINIKYFLIVGGVFVFLGVLLPLLMVVHVLEPTFFLNFISYIFSVIGLFLGSIGAMTFVKNKRDKK